MEKLIQTLLDRGVFRPEDLQFMIVFTWGFFLLFLSILEGIKKFIVFLFLVEKGIR